MLTINRLIWDTWNVAHIARHHVTPEEVEEVCHGQPVTSRTYKGRLRVVGPTRRRRLLAVILAPTQDEGVYYPVTARPADRKERRIYQHHRGTQP
ncbi:MAG: BrnT family toxin [Nitrospinae bacterium]|nr:BrnT family toxin [Nitrospinota bacterium]